MLEMSDGGPAKTRDGNQTLARGLRALLAIADADDGLTVQEVGDLLGVHRSISYRLLQTLVDFGLATRTQHGRYVPGARLATLSEAYLPGLRSVANPVMRTLADRFRSTVSLFVAQGTEAVLVTAVEPTTASLHIALRPGTRMPAARGAVGSAMLAARPAEAGEPPMVSVTRRRGYARSDAELEAGQHAVAAWIPDPDAGLRACLNLITYSVAVADGAGPAVRRAADSIGLLLRRQQ
ncbi:IclR family transcriptional regulator [Phytohabitans suffuscus]|uniref:Transcriptional regulator n=1 Tax=Phytohabitans suffuscus TaxID=624315 RepID=A0A6F8YC95_9ACTN|nr:helix-turn-helix domain-containing protein [Phytohabitans suffuscus]BCB83754.1 hypothetical protein Psuf_010670 [Phytohabitans suffuscus]